MKSISPILIAFLAVLSAGTQPAFATACTPGSNCYCDKVKEGSLNDPNLLLCEDWEAPTLHDNAGVGGGAPYYGPWYDDSGFPGARGSNSYMAKKYPGSNGGIWKLGEPAAPTVGRTCGFGSCWPAEYRSDDLWQGNTTSGGGACADVIKTGGSNADDEGTELGIPDAPGTNDNRGVWDGNQTFGYRVRPNGSACGILGTAAIAPVSEIGVTMAVAYGDNTGSLNAVLTPYPIKHEQYGNTSNASYQETLALGNKIWYGNGTTEKLVFSLTNFNGTALKNQNYNFLIWNSYMNANSSVAGYPGLNGKWRRWIDNVHVRAGVPVSCSQIGFGSPGSADALSPAKPRGLKLL